LVRKERRQSHRPFLHAGQGDHVPHSRAKTSTWLFTGKTGAENRKPVQRHECDILELEERTVPLGVKASDIADSVVLDY